MARYHFARHQTPHLRLEDVRPGRLTLDRKPDGLWYSIDDAWLRFLEHTNPRFIGSYVYAVTLRRGAVLRIRTLPALRAFASRYSDRRPYWNGSLPSAYDIDWPRVATEWAGIEIAPFHWQARQARNRRRLNWHRSWDVASGCIWNPAAIASLELAAERVLVR